MSRETIFGMASRIAVIGLFFTLWLSGPLVLGQEEEPEELPDLKKLCSEVEKEYKNKKDRDYARIEAIYDEFANYYAKYKSSDQKKIVKTLRKAYDVRPPIDDRHFLMKAAGCLSGMGKEGADALLYAVDGKALEPKDKDDEMKAGECRRIKALVIEAIGQTKEPSVIKPLSKMLWDDNAEIIKASCKALGQFNELELSKKKPIVEEVVKVYAYLHNQAQQAIKDPKFNYLKDRLIAVEVAFNETLKKLTNQSLESAPDWEKWYNDNKGKREW